MISDDLSLEVFQVNGSTATQAYYLQIQADDNKVLLHDPCTYCHPSYNQYTFSNRQIILPAASDKLYTITLIDTIPYVQIVHTPGCIPSTIYGPDYRHDLLYLQCHDPSDTKQVLLALLVQDGDSNSFVDWSYDTFPILDGLTGEGSFFEYYDGDYNQRMVYFTYARDEVLIFQEPIDNVLRFIGLPEECVDVVRITPCRNRDYNILLECSSSLDSPTVTNLHVFDPDNGEMTRILVTSYNRTSPIHLVHTDSDPSDTIVVIFAQEEIIVQSISQEDVSARVTIPAPIYDARIATVGGISYAVYSSAGQVYVLNVTRRLQGSFQALRVPLSPADRVCTQPGCPLMQFIDNNTMAVALNGSRVAFISITPQPKVLSVFSSTDQPKRFVFVPSPSPDSTPSPEAPTPTSPAMPQSSVASSVVAVAPTSPSYGSTMDESTKEKQPVTTSVRPTPEETLVVIIPKLSNSDPQMIDLTAILVTCSIAVIVVIGMVIVGAALFVVKRKRRSPPK